MPEKLRGRVLIESTDAFPRNGEGDFLLLAGSELIYVYGRWTAPGDHAKGVCIGAIRSDDEGKTWSEPAPLFEEPGYDIGRKREARKMFDNLLGYANHLGLFSEDIDFETPASPYPVGQVARTHQEGLGRQSP